MRVLVTGASGFVGRHACAALAARGHEVTAAARRDVRLPNVDAVTLDLTRSDAVRDVVGSRRPDAILHLAGAAATGSWDDVDEILRINAAAAGTLLAAVAEGAPEARVLLIGSAHQYGASPAGRGSREADALHPMSPYAVSKVAQELLGMAWAERGLTVVATRSFNHIGPGAPPGTALGSFAAQLAEIGAGRAEPVLHVAELSTERDFLDVRDVAAAYATLLEGGTTREVYNVCSGVAVSMRELLDMAISRSGQDGIEVHADAAGRIDTPRLVGDPAKLRGLGWEPLVTLERSIDDTLAWHRKLAAERAPST